MKRGNYLPAPHAYNLQLACCVLTEAFGPCVYLVGSCLEKRDYRDVDVRAILSDADFDRRFPKLAGDRCHRTQFDPEWSLLCASISLWLEQRTGLPIDFQIQRQTQANAEYEGTRQALGLFLAVPSGKSTSEAAPKRQNLDLVVDVAHDGEMHKVRLVREQVDHADGTVGGAWAVEAFGHRLAQNLHCFEHGIAAKCYDQLSYEQVQVLNGGVAASRGEVKWCQEAADVFLRMTSRHEPKRDTETSP